MNPRNRRWGKLPGSPTDNDVIVGDLTITGDVAFSGDNTFTWLNDFTNGDIVLPIATPVNAVASSVEFVVDSRPVNYVANVQATLATTIADANANLTFTATKSGLTGNDVTIEYVDPSANDEPLSIAVADPAIVITLATDGAGNIKTIATHIIDLITNSVDALLLVGIPVVSGGDGSAKVTALSEDNLSGGIDEILPRYIINGKDFIFCDTAAGDDPATAYPSSISVDTLSAASEEDTATAYAAALATYTDIFDTAYAVGRTVYARYKTKGTVGNAITCVNDLVTPANITDNATGDVLTGGIDGTPGYKGQIYYDGLYTYMCMVDDYTTTQYQWMRSNAQGKTITAGEDLTDCVAYFKASDEKYYLANNDDVLECSTDLLWIVGTIATDGAGIGYERIDIPGTYTAGTRYLGLLGAITTTAPSSPDYIVPLGNATSTVFSFKSPVIAIGG